MGGFLDGLSLYFGSGWFLSLNCVLGFWRVMMRENRRELSYAAYYGLQEVVVPSQEIAAALNDRVEIVTDAGFYRPGKGGSGQDPILYSEVKIADTFFSDVFPLDDLANLFSAAVRFHEENPKNRISFRFLLLDPFSDVAAARANALDQQGGGRVYRRLNKGLHKIVQALAIAGFANVDDLPHNDDVEDRLSELSLVKEQLSTLLDLCRSADGKEDRAVLEVDVRFMDTFQELPFYIFGPYVFKGLVSPITNTRENHWSIYIDDVAEEEDVYDFYSKSVFDGLWDAKGSAAGKITSTVDMIERVLKMEEKNKTIFIGHGHKKDVVNTVKEIIRIRGYEPCSFDDHKLEKRTQPLLIPDIVWDAIRRSCAAILIFTDDDYSLSPDDVESDSQDALRCPRLNVAHELGICQALFGESRTAVIAENGAAGELNGSMAVPSNESGKLMIKLVRDGEQQIERPSLELEINRFLDSLTQ